MESRKIQMVAGMTYSISLPKPWVKKNSLKVGESITFVEAGNGSLILSKDKINTTNRESISINVDEYSDNIEQILLKLYYLGFEKIGLHSKNLHKYKNKIRATLPFLIGTEITNEEENKITLRVLLDKSKVDVIQSLYRMSLITEQMIDSILDEIDLQDMILNENENDRLYNLITKMLSLSLTNSALMQSSKIQNTNFVIHYMLIIKRYEIIADNIYWLAKYLVQNNKKLELEHKRAVADFLRREINRSMKHILSDYNGVFKLPPEEEIKKILSFIDMIHDGKIKEHLSYSLKLVLDNEEDILSISFSKKLIKEGLIE